MKRIILAALLLCAFTNFTYAQEKDFQFSLITPIGTNGLSSGQTTNKVSVNLLGGYSYGNTAFELGGLYNINTNLTKGLLIAGIANYSGNSINASQIAGIANIAKKGNTPLQIGGIANIADKVGGLQLAGIVNVAKQVSGVQVGLVNITDECDGVTVGLINIVKKNGKHEFEISFSESLNTVVSFKLGTDKLYTIFSGGVKYISSPTEYAAGIGFGTHINWNKEWANQIELIGYGLTKNGSFDYDGVNMLAQLRLPVSKQFSKHFKVFAGPVINMTITDKDIINENDESLSPWTMWESNKGDVSLKGWIGLVAGVRF